MKSPITSHQSTNDTETLLIIVLTPTTDPDQPTASPAKNPPPPASSLQDHILFWVSLLK